MRAGILAIFLLSSVAVQADESKIQLEDGAGRDQVVARCGTCHSLDYIPMNSPFPDRKLWEAEVNKMINAFGAPIPKDEVPTIVDYLTQRYGKP
jgi:hypothetical protein